jgi:hypothetical protein
MPRRSEEGEEVEGKLPRPHGLPGCHHRSTARSLSLQSKLNPPTIVTHYAITAAHLSVGPPSVTPPTHTLQLVTELLLKPPCATTIIVATTAHTHKIWSPPHGGGGGGGGVGGALGLPCCPPRSTTPRPPPLDLSPSDLEGGGGGE